MSHEAFDPNVCDRDRTGAAHHVLACRELCRSEPAEGAAWTIDAGFGGRLTVTKVLWHAVAERLSRAVPLLLIDSPHEQEQHRDLLRRAIGVLFHLYTHCPPEVLTKMRRTDMPGVMQVLDSTGYLRMRALAVWYTPGQATAVYAQAWALLDPQARSLDMRVELLLRQAREKQAAGAHRAAFGEYKHMVQKLKWKPDGETSDFMRRIELYPARDSVVFPPVLAEPAPFIQTDYMRRGISPVTDEPGVRQERELRHPNRDWDAQHNPYLL